MKKRPPLSAGVSQNVSHDDSVLDIRFRWCVILKMNIVLGCMLGKPLLYIQPHNVFDIGRK